MSGGIYVHRPARIGRARVHVQRKNEMFFRIARIGRGERINKECARGQIDNGGTGAPDRIDITALELA